MDLIDERLNKIKRIIKDESFLMKKGLGNEIGYYIFDYDPRDELKVRKHIKFLKKKINNNPNNSFKIIEFDLYNIIFEILKENGYLDQFFDFEKTDGIEGAKRAISTLLMIGSESNLIVKYIMDNTPNNSVVFLTGVGKSYPLIRSHNVLNNLHQVLDEVPVIMFFPGKYSGTDLILFGTIKDQNYYRALSLVK